MGRKRMLIISARPLFRQGLKLIIEDAVPGAVVTTARDELTAGLNLKFAADVIIIDRPDIRAVELECFFERGDYPTKIVVIGWDDDKIACYSRKIVDNATVRGLVELISEKAVE